MTARRWPRRNDPASILARREAVGLDGAVSPEELEPLSGAVEALTGVATLPVSVVGPLVLSLGRYELEEPAGTLVERGRETETVYVPLAHTEGGLAASLYRGARAAAAAGGFRTYVLGDRITRASCFVCADTGEAIELARWIEGEAESMRRFLVESDDPTVSRHARLREVSTHVVGPMCHVLWAWTTGDACGPNMMTRNAYLLNMGYVMERAPVRPQRSILEANMGGDKKPSDLYFRGGHGKTVLVDCTIPDDLFRRLLGTDPDDAVELTWAGTHGSIASGMQSTAFTPASAVAAVFAATGQDLGMVATSSMAHATARRGDGGVHCALRFGGLEVGTVGGGTGLPSARRWLEVIDCAGPGKVYRFAQIVAAAALALDISATSAMATAGSENFFRAHHERGGLR